MADLKRKRTEAELIAVLAKHKGELLAIPGVTSCGIGYREKDGVRTHDLSIQCTVATKMSPEQLRAEGIELLPQQIIDDGSVVDVDVVQRSYQPHHELHEAARPCRSIVRRAESDSERRVRADRVAPGCSVGHMNSTAGTLGAIVFDQASGEPLVLSNWHVLHGLAGSVGDSVMQPGPLDNDGGDNYLGRLLRSYIGPSGDCAVATLEGREFTQSIMGLDAIPQRTASVNMDDLVVKSGRTTGVTYGIVTRVGVTVKLDYRGSVGEQEISCFEIGPNPHRPAPDGEISSGGDSGSAWLIDESADRDIIVGLHFAGENDPNPASEHALACPIVPVLEMLKVTLNPGTPQLDEGTDLAAIVRRIERLESLLDQPRAPVHEVEVSRSVLEGNESNRDAIRAGIESGGWSIAWGVTINEPEYAKFIAACAVALSTGNLGAVGQYFQDYLNRSIDKFKRDVPNVARAELVNTVLKALKNRGATFRVDRIGIKAGIASYRRWYRTTIQVPDGTERYKIRGPLGTWTWGYRPKFRSVTTETPLSNHHQPFVGFRLF
jgi:hypothetical protein